MTQTQEAPRAQDVARAAQNAQAASARAEEIAEAVRARLEAQLAQVQGQTQTKVIVPGGGGAFITRPSSPSAVYEGLREQRDELRNQLDRLEDQRENITDELRSGNVAGADQRGLEQRLASVDARIGQVETQLAEADAAVARAAAVPGAVQPPPPPPRQPGPPDEFWVLSGMFIVLVLMPIAIAWARRLWKRGTSAIAAIPQEIYDRFNRLDQAVDSIAIEVERVGEGQRFLTRVYADQRGLGAGPAERVEVMDRQAQRQPLK